MAKKTVKRTKPGISRAEVSRLRERLTIALREINELRDRVDGIPRDLGEALGTARKEVQHLTSQLRASEEALVKAREEMAVQRGLVDRFSHASAQLHTQLTDVTKELELQRLRAEADLHRNVADRLENILLDAINRS